MNAMKLTAILPWFGGKRTLAPRIVEELGEHKYYFEACAGSMAVLFAKEPAHHEAVCDLHGGLINLARVVQKEDLAVELFNRLQRTMYGDDVFSASKDWLAKWEGQIEDARTPDGPSIPWAYHYFICSWMGRDGVAGTERVNYQIATRWTAGGGSGPLRFRNAIDSIPEWCERLRNVHILKRDVFDILPKIEDADGVSIYADPPYIEEGGQYLHSFADGDHARLAECLRRFVKARVVVSYYDHPTLRDLYPGWTVVDCSRQKHLAVQNKRGMIRADAPEVLLINGPSLTGDSVECDDRGAFLFA
jgi:DNA adenine methylase